MVKWIDYKANKSRWMRRYVFGHDPYEEGKTSWSSMKHNEGIWIQLNKTRDMNIIENYQELAKRTLAPLGSQALDGAHMALGITTELGEMEEGIANSDKVNVMEEHGDLNWYLANECNIYGLDFKHIYTVSRITIQRAFSLHKIVDLHKKELAYRKEMDTKLLSLEIAFVIQYLDYIAEAFGFTYEQSLERNIEKLSARYPEKFTTESALNRDLEKERKILEK